MAILTPKDMEIFSGESVLLRCLIEDAEDAEDWKFSWYKRGYVGHSQISDEQEYDISPAAEADSGDYTCRGTRMSDSQHSHTSQAVTLTVSGGWRRLHISTPQFLCFAYILQTFFLEHYG